MKRIFTILLVMTLVLGVCQAGLAEDWTGNETISDRTATFSATVPAHVYSVEIAYTDPAFAVSYTWDGTSKTFKASVTGGTDNGVVLTNNSSGAVDYSVAVTQSETYNADELTARGLTFGKPAATETGSVAVNSASGKLGTVTLASSNAGVAYEAIDDAITAGTQLATIAITLNAAAPAQQ